MSTREAAALQPDRTLRALARYETLRLARHPLFVVGALIFLFHQLTSPFSEYADADYPPDQTETMLDWPVLPAFTLGLAALVALNRLTTSSDQAGDLMRAVPVDAQRRTLALCVAALLPAGLALTGATMEGLLWHFNPPVRSVGWGEYTGTQLTALLASGVLAALGGALLGVLVARWWRWPLAAGAVVMALVLWCLLSFNVHDDDHRLQTLLHMTSPFTPVAANYSDRSWQFGGGLEWRVAYLAGLCLLAALGALAHGTQGEQRRRVVRVVIVVGGLTIAALLLSAFTGPEGQWGRWDPSWT